MYARFVPKLWNETIEAHRHAVREATLDATSALAAEHGPGAVTMSRIAEATGIGRATLYKYFPDVEAILLAWHERQVGRHLDHLTDVADHAADRLGAVLTAYALIQRGHHGHRATFPHDGEHVARARRQLRDFVRGLIDEDDAVRADVAPEELAAYCLHAVEAAADLSSDAAAHRLVGVVLAGLGRGI